MIGQTISHYQGVWSLYVTRNWRLTFRVDAAANEVLDVNYEDYH